MGCLSISDLEKEMSICTVCDLHKTRTQVVFGSGNIINPLIMIIGECPGETEDLEGIPFIGKAGQKLDRILNFVGIKRQDIYITNAILCKTPNNRVPTQQELASCNWRLKRQIELLQPKLIIALGKTALEQLFGHPIKGALNQYFDKWIGYNSHTEIISTYHPSFHLRNPDYAYKTTLPHWKKIKEWVQNNKC